MRFYDCEEDRTEQQWTFDGNKLRSTFDRSHCFQNDQSRAMVADCTDRPEQLWSFDGSRLVSVYDSRCIEYEAEPVKRQEEVKLKRCSEANDQMLDGPPVVNAPSTTTTSARTSDVEVYTGTEGAIDAGPIILSILLFLVICLLAAIIFYKYVLHPPAARSQRHFERSSTGSSVTRMSSGRVEDITTDYTGFAGPQMIPPSIPGVVDDEPVDDPSVEWDVGPRSSQSCPICLDDLGGLETAATTTLAPCGHTLCTTCAKSPVFAKGKLCPLCKRKIESHVGRIF